jgi:hypothetical protein
MVSTVLLETRNTLHKKSSANPRAIQIVYLMDTLIGELRCCIDTWTDVSNLYSQATCLLEKALPFLENGDSHETLARINILKEAFTAAEPFVLDFLTNKGDNAKLQELGF